MFSLFRKAGASSLSRLVATGVGEGALRKASTLRGSDNIIRDNTVPHSRE